MPGRKSFYIIFLAILLYVIPCYASDNRGIFFEVKSRNSTLYILGSIHYMKPDFYPLNPLIEEVFNKSDFLVLEIALNSVNAQEMSLLFLEKGIYKDDDSIERHLSQETIDILQKELKKINLPFDAVKRFKPWFLALTLEASQLQSLGFKPEFGLDKYFFEKATGKKEVIGLETVRFQVDLFDTMSDKEQELYLLYTLKDLSVMEIQINEFLDAWKKGDVSKSEEIVFRPLKEIQGIVPLYEKLFLKRNIKMASRLEEFLKTGKTYFVVVGAGHLMGNEGIIAILKRKNYSVKQL